MPEQQQQQDQLQDKSKSATAGPWLTGCDSYSDATAVAPSSYRWGVNIVSRGGTPRTRPGMNQFLISGSGFSVAYRPKGFIIWTPNNGMPQMVIAPGDGQIIYCEYPFTGAFKVIAGLQFDRNQQIYFTPTVQSVTEAADGELKVLETPLKVLMMCDGVSRTGYWDGMTAKTLNPVKKPNGPSETPTLERMVWSGSRLWGSIGSRIRASNLGNPLKFTEEDILSEGGALVAPDTVTALGQTPDFQNLLIFTDQTTSSIPTTIYDRTEWAQTNGFQKVVLPGIGCAAGKSVVSMYGITWWYSHGGLVALDQALQTYHTSRIHFQDQAMAWSKSNLSSDISRICIGTFENYMLVAVPSGNVINAHTWVMDQSWALEQAISDVYSAARSPTWNGIWTGMAPAEFQTVTIKGVSRCFALSWDPHVEEIAVWELFMPYRKDTGFDKSSNLPIQSAIPCSFETKVLAYGPEYKDYRYIEVDCEDISGVVNITISYAPLRGGYKQVQSQQFVASEWNVVNGRTTLAVNTSTLNTYRSQSRILRTQIDPGMNDSQDANYEGVESTYPRQTDQGFSVLVEWTGQMAVRNVRLAVDSDIQDKEGRTVLNEITDRHVKLSGLQSIEATTHPTVIGFDKPISRFVLPNTRRWVERIYYPTIH